MIRIPVLLVLALIALPVRILVTLWLSTKRGKRTVLVWKVETGRKGLEPEAYEQLLRGLADVAEDTKVGGLRLEVQGLVMGWSQIYQLRDAIRRVRDSGKWVDCHLDSLGDRELLLACVANRISVSPASELYLQGVATPARFFGSALSKHDIVVDLESAGAYKSFGEAYTRSLPTPENREAMDHLLGDLHQRLCDTIASERGCSADDVIRAMAESPLSADRVVFLHDKGPHMFCTNSWPRV